MWKRAYATIAVNNYEEAKKFYSAVLGLSLAEESIGGAMYKAGDSMVLVYPSQYAGTNKATSASFDVEDIAQVVAELKSKGVTFEHYEDMPETILEGDIHISGGNMKAAWFKDPSGNILAVTEMPE